MALILLLIILVFMLVIKSSDRISKSNSDKKGVVCDAIRAQIELDIGIEERVKDKFYQDRFSHLERMSSDMRYVFGENWAELFENCECYRNHYVGRTQLDSLKDCFGTDGFRSIWNIAYQMWLSNQGYVPHGKKKYNIMQGFDGMEYSVSNSTGDSAVQEATREALSIQKECYEVNIRACKVIERNMCRNHPDMELRLCNGQADNDMYRLVWVHWYHRCGITPTSFPW